MAEGFAVLRFVWRVRLCLGTHDAVAAALIAVAQMGSLRLALRDWHLETVWAANWDYAVRIHTKATLFAFIRAWHAYGNRRHCPLPGSSPVLLLSRSHRYTAERQAGYKREAVARQQQAMLTQLQEDIESDLAAFTAEQEEKQRKREEVLRRSRRGVIPPSTAGPAR
jgi:hypothetical protein